MNLINYLLLVNKENCLANNYIPKNLVKVNSKYKEGILLVDIVYKQFLKLKKNCLKHNINIEIMSGYRDFNYQTTLYNNMVEEKGVLYTDKYIMKPGCSEHQTGLTFDFVIYKENICYAEHMLKDLEEINYIHQNCSKYGFILRYPNNKTNVTGINYEPWHLRYVGPLADYFI